MKKIQPTVTPKVLLLLIALASILVEPGSLSAQGQRPAPTPSNNPPQQDPTNIARPNPRSADRANMELNILLSTRSTGSDLERQRQRAAAQLAGNLEHLERINNEKLIPFASTSPLDYKNLTQATAELKARATRIKYYSPVVLVDKTGEKIRYEDDPNQLATMLSQLSRVVTKFVDNKVFRISAPNDQELRSAAAHELETIIKLSDTINKISKRLSKALVATR